MTRILVVDDEEDLREILRFNLEAEGFEVETVASAEEALSTFHLSPFTFHLPPRRRSQPWSAALVASRPGPAELPIHRRDYCKITLGGVILSPR
jgi:hypothetical protein